MKIKQFLIAVCIGTMFTACSSKDDYSVTNDDTIKLRATVAAPAIGTRIGADNAGIINDALPEGDQINVRFYITGTTNDLISGTNSPTNNYYTIGKNGSLTSTVAEPSWNSNPLDIIAFYPKSYSDMGPDRNDDLDCYVDNDQSSIDKYKKSDLMVAQLQGQKKTDGPITLPFKHMLTKIVIKLDGTDSGLDVSTATNFRLYCLDVYSISLNQNHTLYVGYYDDYRNYIKLGNYNSNGVTGIIPPQTLPLSAEFHDDYFITFEINGVKYYYDPTITLKGGYQYTFNLAIDNSTVKAKSFTVEPWETTQGECTQNGDATY